MQVLSVSPSKVAADGGYRLDIVGKDFPLGVPLTVHIGGAGTMDDPTAYSGKVGQGSTVYALTPTLIRCWTRLLHHGSTYKVLVASDTDQALLDNAITAVKGEFMTGVFALRSILPPFWNTKARSILEAIDIETDAPTVIPVPVTVFEDVLDDGGLYIASNGAGLWILARQDKSFYSLNGGTTWFNGYSALVSELQSIRGAVWTGQNFVTVTYSRTTNPSNHIIRYSTTGASWTTTSIANADTDGEQIYGLTSDGAGIVVAVGQSGVIYRSADHGVTWARLESGNFGGDVARIIWNKTLSLFVAAGGNSVRTSPDGLTWTTRSIGALSDTLHLLEQNPMTGAMVVGTTGDTSVLMSTNGVAWVVRPTTFGAHYDLAFIDGLFWMCGEQVVTSQDGNVWNPVTPTGDFTVQICGADGFVLAILDSNGVVKSTDGGTTWTVVTSTPEVIDDFVFDPATAVALVTREVIGSGGAVSTWRISET